MYKISAKPALAHCLRRTMKLLFLAIIIPLTFVSSEDVCSRNLKWSTKDGNLIFNGDNIFTLKGVNWWGAQSSNAVPHGIQGKYKHKLKFYLNFMQRNNFNAIRYAFSAKMVLENTPVKRVNCRVNPDICGLKALDMVEKVIDEAANRGMLVMLDFHTFGFYNPGQLWYNKEYPESKVLEVWDILLTRFATKWNLFALDLSNEPHGGVSWGSGNNKTDWRLGAQRIINHIGNKHPKFQGLFFVEGKCCRRWYDVGFPETQIQTGNRRLDERVVYSPHHYRAKDTVKLGRIYWDRAFGRVENLTGHATVMGEWGDWDASPEGPGMEWANSLVEYLQENCMADTFYLSLNGGSRGLLRGRKYDEPVWSMIELLHKLQPNPSKLKIDGKEICVTPGKPVVC